MILTNLTPLSNAERYALWAYRYYRLFRNMPPLNPTFNSLINQPRSKS